MCPPLFTFFFHEPWTAGLMGLISLPDYKTLLHDHEISQFLSHFLSSSWTQGRQTVFFVLCAMWPHSQEHLDMSSQYIFHWEVKLLMRN